MRIKFESSQALKGKIWIVWVD